MRSSDIKRTIVAWTQPPPNQLDTPAHVPHHDLRTATRFFRKSGEAYGIRRSACSTLVFVPCLLCLHRVHICCGPFSLSLSLCLFPSAALPLRSTTKPTGTYIIHIGFNLISRINIIPSQTCAIIIYFQNGYIFFTFYFGLFTDFQPINRRKSIIMYVYELGI